MDHYYRLSFKRVTVPNRDRPLDRKWEWFDLVCAAENRQLAKDHGHDVARDQGVDFVDAMRLPRVVGMVLIKREPAFQPLNAEASKTPLAMPV